MIEFWMWAPLARPTFYFFTISWDSDVNDKKTRPLSPACAAARAPHVPADTAPMRLKMRDRPIDAEIVRSLRRPASAVPPWLKEFFWFFDQFGRFFAHILPIFEPFPCKSARQNGSRDERIGPNPSRAISRTTHRPISVSRDADEWRKTFQNWSTN